MPNIAPQFHLRITKDDKPIDERLIADPFVTTEVWVGWADALKAGFRDLWLILTRRKPQGIRFKITIRGSQQAALQILRLMETNFVPLNGSLVGPSAAQRKLMQVGFEQSAEMKEKINSR